MTTVVATYMTEVEEERIRWVWRGHLARGKLTVHEGDPGLGKSTVGIDVFARLSRGDCLPGECAHMDPMRVGIICDEDGLRDTIKPRLVLAGAKMTNVVHLTGQTAQGRKHSLLIPDHLDEIAELVWKLKLDALYVDPLDAHAGPSVRLINPQDVRTRVTGPLGALAEETDSLAILARHPNKQLGLPALYRGGGALAIIGAARFGFTFGRDPEDREHFVIAPVKCNIGKFPPSLGYRLTSQDGSDHAQVVWDTEPVDLTADDLYAAAADKEWASRTAAERWLLSKLVLGPRPASALEAEAEAEHIGWRSVEKAKRKLHVEDRRRGFGPSSQVWWLLPGQVIRAEESDQEQQESQQEMGL